MSKAGVAGSGLNASPAKKIRSAVLANARDIQPSLVKTEGRLAGVLKRTIHNHNNSGILAHIATPITIRIAMEDKCKRTYWTAQQ